MRELEETHSWIIYEFTKQDFCERLGIPRGNIITIENNVMANTIKIRFKGPSSLVEKDGS